LKYHRPGVPKGTERPVCPRCGVHPQKTYNVTIKRGMSRKRWCKKGKKTTGEDKFGVSSSGSVKKWGW